jgi:hypothetical protein
VNGNGLGAASAASINGLPAGKQWVNVAEPLEGNPYLRLEHELQTAMKAAARGAAVISLDAHGTARHCSSSSAADTRLARQAPAVLIPLKGFGMAYVAVGALCPEI